MVKQFIKKVYFYVDAKLYGVVSFGRKKYYQALRKRLLNPNPTIISSDCFGGFVYNNLGLKFNSPTINLFFSKNDFWTFTKNLKSFLDAELIEVSDNDRSYPVGKLKNGGGEKKSLYTLCTINLLMKQRQSGKNARKEFPMIIFS